MSTTNINLSCTMANIDLVMAAAKRLKAAKRSYDNKTDAEDRARKSIAELQQEAHAVTSAMVEGRDTSEMRDLADIQRDLRRSNTALDRVLERFHEDRATVEEAFAELTRFMSAPVVVEVDSQEKEAA